VRRRTHCAASQLRSDNRGESVDEAWALRRPCPPRNRPAAGASSRGWTAEHPNSHTGHRFARPRLPSARRLCPRNRAEQRDGPCGCLLPTPSGCAWGAQGAGWRVCRRTHPLRHLTRRGCPSAARQRVASSTAHPAHEHPRLPRSAAKGSQTAGSPFFCLLFFGEAKKSESAAGPRPGLCPESQHTSQTNAKALAATGSARTNGAAPRLRQAQPER
jgi:hypothetical protein